MLRNWFLPKTLSEKSKWKRQFDDLVMKKEEERMRFFARVDKIVGVFGIPGSKLACRGREPEDSSAHCRLRIRTAHDLSLIHI